MSRLCKRLGDFKSGYYSERAFHKPAPEPVSHVCREEWREYQKERRRQEEEKKNARERWKKEREKLERQQRERRKTAAARLARHGLSLLNITQHFLKAQGQEEKAALRDSQPQPEKQERLPRFKHWLGKRTPYLAHIWRFRKRIRREGQTTGIPQSRLASPYTAYWEMVKKRFPEGCVIENG